MSPLPYKISQLPPHVVLVIKKNKKTLVKVMLIIIKQVLCQRLNHKTDHNLYFQIIRLLIAGGLFC